jgi:hypothetical protein
MSNDELLATADEWLAFVAAHDDDDESDRQFTYRFRERVYGVVYRRERKEYPRWIDHGGEG